MAALLLAGAGVAYWLARRPAPAGAARPAAAAVRQSAPHVVATTAARPVKTARKERPTPAIGTNELDAMFDYLRGNRPRPGMRKSRMNSDKDNLMCRLEQAPVMPRDLGTRLARLSADTNADIVARDYALQHLDPVCCRLAAENQGWTNSAEAAELRGALMNALQVNGTTLPGTALLAMGDLAAAGLGFERKELQAAALRMVQSPEVGDFSRTTAMRLCGQWGRTEALDAARDWARNEKKYPLRIAAIATLGDLGDATDGAELQRMLAAAPKGLRPALENAVRNIARRQALAQAGK